MSNHLTGNIQSSAVIYNYGKNSLRFKGRGLWKFQVKPNYQMILLLKMPLGEGSAAMSFQVCNGKNGKIIDIVKATSYLIFG